MKMYDYNKIKEICLRHRLVCELYNYFCLPTDLNHFVVYYKSGNIKLSNKWVLIDDKIMPDLIEDKFEPYARVLSTRSLYLIISVRVHPLALK